MSRIPGMAPISTNYEPKVSAPFDARSLVPLKSDLTNASSWSNFVYDGMLTVVSKDTTENNGLYILLDKANITVESSWQKLADISDIDALNQKIDSVANSIIVQVATKGNLPNAGSATAVYLIQDENAVYRWNTTTSTYECTGRNYEEIKEINCGNAVDF